MCKRWVRQGHRVTVITGTPNAPEGKVYKGYRNRLVQRETIEGIEIIRLWTFIAANRGKIRRILNYLSYLCVATLAGAFIRRPDVLIATSPQFFCGIAGQLIKSFRRVPFVLEIRDIWPESISAVGAIKAKPIIRLLERMELGMYESADHIVTVGEGYREQLIDRNVPAEKISVVTNGVDKELFVQQTENHVVRGRHNLNGEFVCGYVGTLGMASGLEVVLKAATMLKEKGRNDICFMLVGDGAIRKALEAEAKAKGLDNIRFTGRREKSEVPAYLAALDVCLVHLRRKDLFRYVLPSKIFEAAAMSKPIVLGVEGHAAELVKNAEAGILIEPDNAEELTAAVEQLAGDREASNRFGAAGRAYVMRHFDRDRLSDDYLSILERVGYGEAIIKKKTTL